MIEYNTDEDWYTMKSVAGQACVIELKGFGRNGLDDAFVSIHGSDGTVIAAGDYGGEIRASSMSHRKPAHISSPRRVLQETRPPQ